MQLSRKEPIVKLLYVTPEKVTTAGTWLQFDLFSTSITAVFSLYFMLISFIHILLFLLCEASVCCFIAFVSSLWKKKAVFKVIKYIMNIYSKLQQDQCI